VKTADLVRWLFPIGQRALRFYRLLSPKTDSVLSGRVGGNFGGPGATFELCY